MLNRVIYAIILQYQLVFLYLYVVIPQYNGTKMGRVLFCYHVNKYVYLGKKEENKWWAMRDLNP